MESQTFDLEENRLQKEIVKRKAKIVLIQLPEGLKTTGPRLATLIEDLGSCAIISADPCYGACDLATATAFYPSPSADPIPGLTLRRRKARSVPWERAACRRHTPSLQQGPWSFGPGTKGSEQATPVCLPAPRIRKVPSPFRAEGTLRRSTPPHGRS